MIEFTIPYKFIYDLLNPPCLVNRIMCRDECKPFVAYLEDHLDTTILSFK